MESYSSLAGVYDLFMDNIDYENWCGYLTGLLHSYEIYDGLVLELGCGTGIMTELLQQRGYDMIGVDNSAQMLQAAMEKREQSQADILYLLQDMREFELFGTVRAVVSVCDSMNYILEEEELLQVFRLVNNYLDPGGYFIFDMNTLYKYKEVIGEQTIAENRDEASFIWENYFDEETSINEYALTIFKKEQEGLYRKYEEYHEQRAYDIEAIKKLLLLAGLEFVAVYDAFSRKTPEKDSQRVYFVARECEKTREDIKEHE